MSYDIITKSTISYIKTELLSIDDTYYNTTTNWAFYNGFLGFYLRAELTTEKLYPS